MVHRLLSFIRARLAAGTSLLTASAATDIITCGALTEVAADDATARVLLFPMGDTALRGQGRTIRLVDQAHARRVITASVANAGAANIPVDYDHQLVFAAGKGVGGQAPAAGWIDPASLMADAAGIWATVEWTTAAAARLAAREYRYVSPSFFAAADGALLAIAHLSLVNYPAITDLPAVAAALDAAANPKTASAYDSATQPETPKMDKIALALGLAADATMEAILAAIAKMTMPPEAMATAAAALGLAVDATASQIITAAAAATPDPAKFVPIAALQDTTARLAVLETERRDAIVTAAAESGKLTPALRGWFTSLLATNEAAATAWLKDAPAIVTAGAHLSGSPAPADANGLTATEIQIASAMGVSPDELATTKKKEAR